MCNSPNILQDDTTTSQWLRTKRMLLTLLVLSIIKASALADISPEPVTGKGIIPLHPVNIQMVSEVVKVDLTVDSAFVECTFNMHNLGNAQDLSIGFPIMNFYLWDNDYLSPVGKNRFDVSVKGREIEKINIYIPDDLEKLLSRADTVGKYALLQTYKYENRPWYLWKTHFNKHENLTIVVKYRLPNGATHANSFFNYLLSTGAGWKGKIEDAKVIVNLVIPRDQVLNFLPKKYVKTTEKQIVWDFKNFKPTTKDDILIEYEMIKGDYKAYWDKLDSQMPTYIDGKLSKQSMIDTSELGYFVVNHDPAERHHEMIVFTKTAILQKFKNVIKKVSPNFWKQISNESAKHFEQNYSFEINGSGVSHGFLFEQLYGVDTMKFITAKIIKPKKGKKLMIITAHSIVVEKSE